RCARCSSCPSSRCSSRTGGPSSGTGSRRSAHCSRDNRTPPLAAPSPRVDTRRVRIAIVGGGIGGLTAATALRRAGAEVTVLEQAAELLPVGASLQLGPNATRLLAELELLEPLRAVASRPDAVDLLRWDDG